MLNGTHSATAGTALEMKAVTASGNHHALVVPAGGTWNDDARPTDDPHRTLTTRETSALVMPYYGASQSSQPTSKPIGTLTTVDRYALIQRHNSSKGDGAEMLTPAHEPRSAGAAWWSPASPSARRTAEESRDRAGAGLVGPARRSRQWVRASELVRQLFLDFPDRVLFGSDAFGVLDPAVLRTHYRLLETRDEHFPYSSDPVPLQGRWAVSGLGLPQDVLEAVYQGNAGRLLPDLR